MGSGPLSIDVLLTLHHLVELRLLKDHTLIQLTPLLCNLPLFRTLSVFEAERVHPSFLAGQTFHKLERCREGLYEEDPSLIQTLCTEMSICTRLDVCRNFVQTTHPGREK